MNRGMIALSPNQIQLVSESLATIQNVPAELPDRINYALAAGTNPTEILLSEDSVEAVLDALPTPQPNEATVITETRTAFRLFLNNLRHTATSS